MSVFSVDYSKSIPDYIYLFRPSILPLNLPNIILPKEPLKADLPTTMIHGGAGAASRPKIFWKDEQVPPPPSVGTEPMNTVGGGGAGSGSLVVTKPVTTVPPSTTHAPSAITNLKEYRINRTPTKHGSTGKHRLTNTLTENRKMLHYSHPSNYQTKKIWARFLSCTLWYKIEDTGNLTQTWCT